MRAVKEFQQRRLEYNSWIGDQAKAAGNLYVGGFFSFNACRTLSCESEQVSEEISKRIASSPPAWAPRNDDKLSLRANEVSEAISKIFRRN